tara:strand:+ start:3446 stop:3718 length:273 start_codon:yes stop_codon:yes gene_type:complete
MRAYKTTTLQQGNKTMSDGKRITLVPKNATAEERKIIIESHEEAWEESGEQGLTDEQMEAGQRMLDRIYARDGYPKWMIEAREKEARENN